MTGRLLQQMLGGITCGDCIEVMAHMPARCVDLILTDPPYLVRYRDRGGRRIVNDDDSAWLAPAYRAMHRLLRDDAVCVTFYGWSHADAVLLAARDAGFRPAGHIVFPKRYASRSRLLRYQHEQAYLFAKGRPPEPEAPPSDVIGGWRYTGNCLHPTQKPVGVLTPLIEAFSTPDGIVLDPFCGSGSTLLAAQRSGRRYIGIEIEAEHHAAARARLAQSR